MRSARTPSDIPNAPAKSEAPQTARLLPPHLARAVRRGHLDATQALDRAAWEAEVAALMRRYGLDRSLASQILHGEADLQRLLDRRACRAYVLAHGAVSVFATALSDGAPRALHTGAAGYLEGTITADRPYEVALQFADGTTTWLHKLRIRAVSEVPAGRRLRRDRVRGTPSDAAPSKPQDRYALSDGRLFRAFQERRTVTATWLDGERVRGVILGFSRFEILLRTRSCGDITLMRHAIADFDDRPEPRRAT